MNANAVAELTFSKMLDISRGTFTANYDVKVKHEWDKYKFVGRELRGKTLGVMGFGRIGRRVGELGRAFGMTVVAYDPFLKPEDFEKENVTGMSIEELLKVSDFVSIHVPLTPDTKDLFNAKSIAGMKNDAVVLNMSRGGIVNEQDMYEALKAGTIGGYATDVLENELAGSGLTGNDSCCSIINLKFNSDILTGIAGALAVPVIFLSYGIKTRHIFIYLHIKVLSVFPKITTVFIVYLP